MLNFHQKKETRLARLLVPAKGTTLLEICTPDIRISRISAEYEPDIKALRI